MDSKMNQVDEDLRPLANKVVEALYNLIVETIRQQNGENEPYKAFAAVKAAKEKLADALVHPLDEE